MGRCSNASLLAKIGQKPIDTNAEIDFSVRRALPDCRRINAKNAIDKSLAFNRYHKPTNRFECGAQGCSTTGTATIEDSAKYFAQFDATEYSSGVVTFYVEPTVDPTVVTFTISDAEDLADADVYEVTITDSMKTDDGFVPVLIDLSKAPTSEVGGGWTASQNGSYIQIAVDNETGLSTLSILDSVEDFETTATVKMACISSAGGSYDLSLIEQTCREAELDSSISTLTFPITARLITPNHYLLTPMYSKGRETEGFELVTVEKTVAEYIKDGVTYGRVVLTDAHPSECRFWAVQMAESCSPFESTLTELSVPTLIGVDAGHFQVIRNDSGVEVIFNEEHIGHAVLIEYPKTAEIEEIIMGTDDLNGVKTSMTVPYKFDGEVKELHVYDDVIVTGFPFGLSNTDSEASFSITINKRDNKFFRIQRYMN